MTVWEAIKRLESSKTFTSWKKNNQVSYLVHSFKMYGNGNDEWQIGYFNPRTDLISVFVVDEKITKNEDAEVFKEQEKLVQPLELKEVQVSETEALEKAKEILEDDYREATVVKSFMILQNLETIGQVWNITFLTRQFKTINIKIDAKTGECKEQKVISLIQGREE